MKTVKNSISFYDKSSGIYNLCLDWIFNTGRKKVARFLNTRKKLNVLEIGSGTGSFLNHVNVDLNYVGIDGSIKMCNISKEKFPNHTFLNIKYEDYHPTCKYDVIVINYTLSVVDNPEDLILKVSSWLDSNGKVYIVNHFSTESWFYKLLQKVSVYCGYNAYFPFNPNLFSNYFNITIFKSVNLFGAWKFIELTLKKDEKE